MIFSKKSPREKIEAASPKSTLAKIIPTVIFHALLKHLWQ
jgi:hypothetical protein